MNGNHHQARRCRYVLVCCRDRNPELVEDQPTWRVLDAGDGWFFCTDMIAKGSRLSGNWSLDIGARHDNGDGLHVRIVHDRDERSLRFHSDMMTALPIYYWHDEDHLLVTSDLGAMIEAGRALATGFEVNSDAMSELFISSYFFSGRHTALCDVKMVPRNSLLKVSLDDCSTSIQAGASSFAYHHRSWKWRKCVELFRKALEEGMRCHQTLKIAIPLSGGADSRTVAASAFNAGLDADLFTIGQSTVNDSDFAVASVIAHKFGKKTRCITATAENFLVRWKNSAEDSNWANDSLWWAAKLPESFFRAMGEYDVILRGDGEGAYGWGDQAADISDVLHYLEITPPVVVRRFDKYFSDRDSVFSPALRSRNELIEKNEACTEALSGLKNRLYMDVREWLAIAPCLHPFTRVTAVDAPFLWADCLEVARRIPKGKRTSKQVIFEVLDSYPEIRNVPRSRTPSWNNDLEFYCCGVWEELLDHVARWSRRPLNLKALRQDYLKPPAISSPPSLSEHAWIALRQSLKGRRFARRLVNRFRPGMLGTSMSQRLLIRLAIESCLHERLASSAQTDFKIK